MRVLQQYHSAVESPEENGIKSFACNSWNTGESLAMCCFTLCKIIFALTTEKTETGLFPGWCTLLWGRLPPVPGAYRRILHQMLALVSLPMPVTEATSSRSRIHHYLIWFHVLKYELRVKIQYKHLGVFTEAPINTWYKRSA